MFLILEEILVLCHLVQFMSNHAHGSNVGGLIDYVRSLEDEWLSQKTSSEVLSVLNQPVIGELDKFEQS